ncbi:hypothetical protein SPBR_03490 [Sporothrix brasiliensis 5110]|uniref:Aminoglycoside phosphotransferase domain-containing protein n=1 Tax=Sporothrix brasiliensis 5110 TaxID=1398154 RepID=A0A0C2FVR9_9PEZI|nr:uncharacterized protein SPBR_03490 [Sporothrix brasiliensis 5110]KIH95103.1 hypothetical protein SPBR_03490 [Sporothrix brasiliensis 5110]
MAPPTDEEKDVLQQALLARLAPTPFACTGPLTALTSGTTNFVFRGVLAHPTADGAPSIVIKHATDYAAANKDFPLDVTRSLFEETMLNALNDFPRERERPTTSFDRQAAPFEAKAPRLLWFDRATNTQVLEDFPAAVDLKSMLLAAVNRGTETRHRLAQDAQLSRSVGVALGAWLRSFHAWTSERGAARSALRLAMAANEPMRRLKRQITYDALVRVVAQFPEALGGRLPILEAVQAAAAAEFDKTPPAEREDGGDDDDDDDREDWGIIHGDFWSGNILLPDEDHLKPHAPGQPLFVVDWEFAQYGRRAYDIGQLLGDLVERDHFRGAKASRDVLAGFVSGYFGEAEEKTKRRRAFRIAIHAGVQLIGCFIRRAPTGPLPGTPEQVRQAIQLGTDFVVKAWTEDRVWFQNSVLAPLFE